MIRKHVERAMVFKRKLYRDMKEKDKKFFGYIDRYGAKYFIKNKEQSDNLFFEMQTARECYSIIQISRSGLNLTADEIELAKILEIELKD